MSTLFFVNAVDDDDTDNIVSFRDRLSCFGEVYFNGNTTNTVINAINTPVQVVGTYISGDLDCFTHSLGKATYAVGQARHFEINCTMTARASAILMNKYNFYVAIDDAIVSKSTDAEYLDNLDTHVRSPFLSIITELQNGSNVSIYVENTEGTQNLLVENLNLIISRV